MPLFFVSRQVSYKREIKAPLQAVLRVLHDPPAVMGLSPLIDNVSVDLEDKTKYTILHSLVLPFGYRTKISYKATITLPDDGMHAESTAGAGTRTNVRYTARTISGGLWKRPP
jgi:carbon monoxide dehydrogenase subunit G